MDFSVKVVSRALLNKEATKNIVCSPLSIEAVLNMVAVGSKGRTLEQLLGCLGSKTLADINTKFLGLMAVAANNSSAVSEKVAGGQGPLITFVNGVWVDQRYTLKPSYQQVLKSVFRAEAKALDFVNKADEAIEELNSWANNATNGLIKKILSPESVGSWTMLMLANALYFKGAWDRAFDASMTKEDNFYLINGEMVQVPFMHGDLDDLYFYKSFDGFKVVKLLYKKGYDQRRFSMHLFLPDERDGLPKLIQKFNDNSEFLNQHLATYCVELAKFWIPKFKFSHTLQASEIMQDLGLDLPFVCVGELTEMIDNPDGENFCATGIFQKSYIEVNEEGTEAAAVTAMDFGCCLGSDSPPPPSFVADHPFMFMIKEDTSGTPFFIGAVLNPLDG